MLEKISIRWAMSFIMMWFIFHFYGFVVELDTFILIMMCLYALFVSVIIESIYALCRQYIEKTLFITILFFFFSLLICYFYGRGIYLGLTVYIVVSIVIDLWREYHITKLLKQVNER